MDVLKEAGVGAGWDVGAEDLALINAQSRKTLEAGEVYAFTVRLCDNEVDRDWERFTAEALETLAERFVGRSGVFDHDWSAKGQTARIYRAEVVDEPETATRVGDGYRYLKGYAYMLRTEANRDLIAEIEGGIKKEVSVGCAVRAAVCSVCGHDLGAGTCRHEKGRTYGGKFCCGELREVTDVYEWSFVAVPAQPRAGVIKTFAPREEALEEEAALGRRYLSLLRDEVVRLGGLAEPQMDGDLRRRMTEKLAAEELEALKGVYESRVAQRLPVGVQLTYRGEKDWAGQRDGAFLI